MDFIILPANIRYINKLLIEHYGLDPSTNQANWRVAWANDQYENRLVEYDDNGNLLQRPEVRNVPKYSHWCYDKWVLERLVVVPEINRRELPDNKLSYEPIFPFHNDKEEAIQPSFEASKFVIDTVYAAMNIGEGNLSKYKEGNSQEIKEKRVAKLQEELFGDETDVSDHLSRQTGIVVPHSYDTKES